MSKSHSIKLKVEHFRTDIDVKSEVGSLVSLFMSHWMMLDRLLLANDRHIEGIRVGKIDSCAHEVNGELVTEQEADKIHPSVGEMHRRMAKDFRADWEAQFEKSQNWLRLTTLAQAYLIWEDHIRGRFVELINFDHAEIDIDKEKATIRANIFGDLSKVRHSMWHASSGDLGICFYENSEFLEINKFVKFEKDKPLIVSADELPPIGHHLMNRLQEFPEGYSLGIDARK